jgi:tRNA(Ile)-lysidine synthetase-like protein
LSPLELVRHVRRFFDTYHSSSCPFVFGCSGGVDSTALLHLLQEAGCTAGHVVHVDHGWRPESSEEAVVLRDRATSLSWPCTTVRLGEAPAGVNIEDWCRSERLAVFRSVATSLGTDVIVLAHQADDQTEVVLKRFFEGASLLKFRGMRAVERREGLTILRPLLSIRREDLLGFLHERNIPYFIDPTNSDTSFLRARMRVEMVPLLERSFGKGVAGSLLRVADESAALEEFVCHECERRFVIQRGQGSVFVSASDEISPFLVRSTVDRVREELSLPSPSRSVVEGIVRAFCGRPSGARSFLVGEGGFFVESRFFAAFQRRPPPVETVSCETAVGQHQTGCWKISWQPSTVEQKTPHWFSLFAKKAVSWYIPAQPFRVCRMSDRLLRTAGRRSVNKPSAALRPFVPAVVQAFTLVADPLSGYTVALEPGSPCFEVTIQHTME